MTEHTWDSLLLSKRQGSVMHPRRMTIGTDTPRYTIALRVFPHIETFSVDLSSFFLSFCLRLLSTYDRQESPCNTSMEEG